tara:strand:+ start:673 stop:1056 length:384 start_codon:yes stop_codon:yes gene_type:complete
MAFENTNEQYIRAQREGNPAWVPEMCTEQCYPDECDCDFMAEIANFKWDSDAKEWVDNASEITANEPLMSMMRITDEYTAEQMSEAMGGMPVFVNTCPTCGGEHFSSIDEEGDDAICVMCKYGGIDD